MNAKRFLAALSASAFLGAGAAAQDTLSCPIELVVLGAGQDAGAPQIGNADDDGPRLLPSSLGLIDREAGTRYLFDATPAITQQMAMLDAIEPPKAGLGIDGVFLTHAHIGHYLGLAYLGREAAGASGVPVYAMPRMQEFLRSNGPWSQLVEQGNIDLQTIRQEPWAGGERPDEWRFFRTVRLPNRRVFGSIFVPHRDEYSETVGWAFVARLTAFRTSLSVLYLPDIDSWADPETQRAGYTLEDHVNGYDFVFLDATFWDDNELFDENGVGRDMSEIPHPRVTETMDRLQGLSADLRAKVHFIHYNHTNPIRDPASAESREVIERGFNVARRGDRHCLVPSE